MSQINLFKCDACKKQVPAKYNGEHYLPPVGWVQLVDTDTVKNTGEHLCTDCLPKTPQNKQKRLRSKK